MSDHVAIIKAAGETAAWAKAYGVKIELHIGKSMGHGAVDLTLTPDGSEVKLDDAPTMVLEQPVEPPLTKRPIRDDPKA
jgi:hypothetical protein